MTTENNNIHSSSDSTMMMEDDESFYSYDNDNQDMESMTDQFDNNFHFTNLDRLKKHSNTMTDLDDDDDDDDDSWDVESYAADSMEVTKLRLHIIINSELGREAEQGGYYDEDDDDWTVQSDCNDSIGLTKNRLQHNQQYQQYQPQQQQPGITRRRRQMSMSSASTVEESFSSVSAADPAAAADSEDKLRIPVIRHRSMPVNVVKSATTTTVPLWDNGISPPPRPQQQQMTTRSVSNNGTPCAA